jgi:hypothetical protein
MLRDSMVLTMGYSCLYPVEIWPKSDESWFSNLVSKFFKMAAVLNSRKIEFLFHTCIPHHQFYWFVKFQKDISLFG